ncbi:acyltransferase family protein [Clostridium celatum]|uniref:acyltransferase n=1 Tax=Clostridium celatum TaxID=36834 RepID=UPI00290036C3|nr:acyltransferase family protein [Clostridium celatum]MDU2265552.1 acyltransferase family protein [Clostridium celatum]MDU6295408.1 acyltransferase family protein [Clostridium celatum]
MKSYERDSSFETLRIIAMLMVITLHYLLFGGALSSIKQGDRNYWIITLIESMCIISVNLFILITSYFMAFKNKINIKKVILLVFSTYFYGVLLYVISVLLGINDFTLIDMIKAIDPFIGNWFLKTYIILYVLSPYINIGINNLTKEDHKKLILIMGIFFSIWPSFLPGAPNNDGGYGIISFIFLYIIGVYIRKYDIKGIINSRSIIIYALCAVVTTIFRIFKWDSAWSYNFIFNIIGSIALFNTFKNLKFRSSKINYISKFTFSIFIIHINPLIVELVYKGLLRCTEIYSNKLFILYMFGSVIIIYLISLLVGFVIDKIIYRIVIVLKNILIKFIYNNKIILKN